MLDNKNKFKFLLISLICSVGIVGVGFMRLFIYCVLYIINVLNKVLCWFDFLDVCVCLCVCVCE